MTKSHAHFVVELYFALGAALWPFALTDVCSTFIRLHTPTQMLECLDKLNRNHPDPVTYLWRCFPSYSICPGDERDLDVGERSWTNPGTHPWTSLSCTRAACKTAECRDMSTTGSRLRVIHPLLLCFSWLPARVPSGEQKNLCPHEIINKSVPKIVLTAAVTSRRRLPLLNSTLSLLLQYESHCFPFKMPNLKIYVISATGYLYRPSLSCLRLLESYSTSVPNQCCFFSVPGRADGPEWTPPSGLD